MTTSLAPSTGATVLPAPRDARVAWCETTAGLGAINRPGVTMAIWRRSLPLCLGGWIGRLDPTTLPDLRILVRPTDLRRALLPFLADVGGAGRPMRDLLVGDVDTLVRTFSDIAGCDHVDVRLERITDDACWKFHRDSVDVRLLTTYRGPATEWVTPGYAEQALREQKGYAGPIERLQAHDVAVFKGRNGDPQDGIVHRSPAIADQGIVRWLLCLNKPTRVSPAPWSADVPR
ncbi:MAG: DUF1826 domain-containing protein [Bacteroidales bacterium]|nr:DUF1826 domain-containing protein [Bacteroidales bacterium]